MRDGSVIVHKNRAECSTFPTNCWRSSYSMVAWGRGHENARRHEFCQWNCLDLLNCWGGTSFDWARNQLTLEVRILALHMRIRQAKLAIRVQVLLVEFFSYGKTSGPPPSTYGIYNIYSGIQKSFNPKILMSTTIKRRLKNLSCKIQPTRQRMFVGNHGQSESRKIGVKNW